MNLKCEHCEKLKRDVRNRMSDELLCDICDRKRAERLAIERSATGDAMDDTANGEIPTAAPQGSVEFPEGDTTLDSSIMIVPDTQSDPGSTTPPVNQAVPTNCLPDCAGGSSDWIRCCLCGRWYHTHCVDLPSDEADGVWPCPTCRTLACDVKTMAGKIDQLSTLLQDVVCHFKIQTEDMRGEISQLQVKCTSLACENITLKTENTTLKDKLKNLPGNKTPIPTKRTLVLGSSLVRNLDEVKLQDTEVRCLRGARVTGIAQELQALADKGRRYRRVILLVGGNDAAADTDDLDLEAVVKTFRGALEVAKGLADDVAVAEIPPRLRPAHALCNITALNVSVNSLCDELDVTFLPNSTHFYLQTGEVNDGYLYDDVHLTIKGSEKLAKSMGLEGRANASGMASLRARHTPADSRPQPPPRQQQDASGWQEQGGRNGKRGHTKKRGYGNKTADVGSVAHGHVPKPTARHDEDGGRAHTGDTSATDSHRAYSGLFWERARKKAGVRNSRDTAPPNHHHVHTKQQPTYYKTTEDELGYCAYCGEDNHTHENCSFKKKIECYKCHRLGHKMKYCALYY